MRSKGLFAMWTLLPVHREFFFPPILKANITVPDSPYQVGTGM